MKLKVLGVSGSLRANSHGFKALNLVLKAAEEFGADVRMLDLR
jgi:multimeric flavodoxin WrbA